MEIELNRLINTFTEVPFKVLNVHHYIIEPGSSGLQRTSPYPGFMFPLSGRAEFSFNGTPYTAYSGNIIHAGGNMSLGKRVLGNEKWEQIVVIYDLPPEHNGLDLANMHFELKTGKSPRLTALLWKTWRAYNRPGILSSFRCELLFRSVLEEVFVCINKPQYDDAKVLFESVSSYIHEHYMDPLTVSGLAEQNGVNENRLFYVFSKYAGIGPGDYLTAYRLNLAKELLITSDCPVGEVASRVGYSDPLYFSRIFRKRFSLSPSGIRAHFGERSKELLKNTAKTAERS